MGKAIVINGLTVSNPLKTVTFRNSESIIAGYKSALTSLGETMTSTEESALNTFIQGLLDANLWDKVKYFYPMLGTSVDGMLLDVVDTAGEDIFSDVEVPSNVSSSTRNILTIAAGVGLNSLAVNSQRLLSLDFQNLSLISAHNCQGEGVTFSSGTFIRFQSAYGNPLMGSARVTDIAMSSTGTRRNPIMGIGFTYNPEASPAVTQYEIPTAIPSQNDNTIERIIMGDSYGSTCKIYKDKEVYPNGTTDAEHPSYLEHYYPNMKRQLFNCVYAFNQTMYAITEHLTAGQWSTFYDLMLPFLQAVGKHS